MPTDEENDSARMSEDEFNAKSTSAVNEFIDEMIDIVDEYVISNHLAANQRLLVYLYTGLAATREVSEKFWRIGSQYMKELTEILKKEMKNDAD